MRNSGAPIGADLVEGLGKKLSDLPDGETDI